MPKPFLTAIMLPALWAVLAVPATPGQTSKEALKQQAAEGDASAQLQLGLLYDLSRKSGKAAKWYRAAAEQGDAAAQARLGLLYDYGHGVPQDYALAAKWYRAAAEQGAAAAQARLGALYDNGLGVRQDHAQAAKWYRTAAEQGDPLGQLGLGLLYRLGQGVPRDSVRALMWSRLASSPSVGELPEKAPGPPEPLEALMSREQIVEADERAREWRPTTWEELKKRLETR